MFVSMDVSFLENQSYFSKNCLQGEIERKEEKFWETTLDPLPKLILLSPSLDVEKQTQQQADQNPSQTLPNIVDSQTGGETL